jgi:hypothetical protein
MDKYENKYKNKYKNKYENMIIKLKLLEKEKKKLEFKIKILKEYIDEFETNHLFDNLELINVVKDNEHM